MRVSPVPLIKDNPLWRWLVETREELVKVFTEDDADTWFAGKSTTDLPEGTNLYYTDDRVETKLDSYLTADLIESFNLDHGTMVGLSDDDHTQYHNDERANTWLGTKTADDIADGATNKYYTNEKVDDRVSNLMQDGTGITWSYVDAANTLTPTVSLTPFSTSDLSEGTNLYYTQARFNTEFANKSTTDLTEGTNLYFTDERVDDRVGALVTDTASVSWTYTDSAGTLEATVLPAGVDHGGLAGLNDDDHTHYHNDARALTWLGTRSTTDLSEGTNLYYTDARVASYIDANILEHGYEAVTSSTTVTKTKTNFTGSTASQTITLPTAGTSGREVEVFNNASVVVSISGSSVLSELYPNESACFTDTGSDWVA